MPGFGTVTAYILAGGFGTRLRQVVSDRPKALAEILGRPYIYHLLDSLAGFGLKRVVLCTGHMAEMLESFLGSEYRGMELKYSREETPLGTGGALKLAFSRFPAELALCINGDSLTDADLAAFLTWFDGRKEQGALLLAPMEDTARYGSVSLDDAEQVTGFVEKGQSGPGFISAGIYLLRPRCLEGIEPGQAASIEQDVFPVLAAKGLLCAHKVAARFLDIGTPDSYAEAGRFLLGGPDPAAKGAVFLDRDGTIIAQVHYLHDPAGVELLPGAAEGLRRMRDLGLRLVLVSNQSGVGRGYFTRGDVERVHGRLIELLEAQGVRLDALYVCPHAPGDACNCRKPLPGLIERACKELDLDPRLSFVIGDKPCDVDLGLIVNATTFLVTTGYGAAHADAGDCRPHHVSTNLLEAANTIGSILAAHNTGGAEHT
ncbi:HAD-IIIA family hydrolase [Humidesulfovibrio idahonensis]